MDQPATMTAVNAEQLAMALQQLHDIVEPHPPPWWPPAPGWYVLTAALVLVTLVALLSVWRCWQSGAYRRQALRELATLRQRTQAGAAPDAVLPELATLLRRVALHGTPRTQVAALTGTSWIDHLKTHTPVTLEPAVATLLCGAPYARPASLATTAPADIAATFAYVGDWIKRHRINQQASP